MQNLAEIERIMGACIGNAEELLNAAKGVARNGSNRIAYHLTALALEEIGKSSMIFMSSLHEIKEEEGKRPIDWIDDHERKLFWAIWSPRFDRAAPLQSFHEATHIAKHIHETRLSTLYVDPKNLGARSRIGPDEFQNLLNLAEAHLEIRKAKTFRELTEQEKLELDWFFVATEDEQLRPIVFSKTSLEKQAGDPGGWIQ